MNLSSAVRNVPPATRSLILTVVSLYLVNVLVGLAGYGWDRTPLLSVVPSKAFHVWTFVTAGFFESNLIALIANGASFLFAAKYFEQIWGSSEFVRFVGIVTIASVFQATLMVFVEYAIWANPRLITSTEVHGLVAILCGFLVAFKQAVPEHTLSLFKVVSIRVKRLPSLLLAFLFVLFVFQVINTTFLLALFGTVTAWIYIRFYKVQDGIHGDRSESFSFASFFPESLHRFIVPVSNSTFNLLVSLKLCPPLTAALPTHSNSSDTALANPKPLPGSDVADAERRRAIALRALDMRMQSAAGASSGQEPSSAEPAAATAAST
ncbi:eukaryotic integral membrane protein-domain-containing protein [Zopfochytrium polystomum]|nr:eukaryotic integral membrane protein-domain-containing protein [Zopfochytrium polystomum]